MLKIYRFVKSSVKSEEHLLGRFILVIVVLLTAGRVLAETPELQPELPFKGAVPLVKKAPKYPGEEQEQRREGWVVLNYVINEDGRVVDPIIVDSSGNPEFEKSALATIGEWEYSPATLGGQPVSQSESRAKFTFQLEGSAKRASRAFVKQYVRVNESLAKGDIDKAGEQLQKLAAMTRRTLNEDAWYWYVKSEYARAKGGDSQYIVYLRRAVAYEGQYLPEDAYLSALSKLYVQELTEGSYANAMHYAKMIEDLGDPRLAKIVDHAREQRALIESGPTLASPGKIQGGSAWGHELVRNQFSIETKEGQLSVLDLRCDRRRQIFDIDSELTWNVPASWGVCTVFVSGTEGSSFVLYEFLPSGAI